MGKNIVSQIFVCKVNLAKKKVYIYIYMYI